MSLVFFFIFTIAALNGVVVYSLFKGLGFENKQMFYLICLCLVSAHGMVAEECRRLGGFFVGKEVFKCVEISENIKEISDE